MADAEPDGRIVPVFKAEKKAVFVLLSSCQGYSVATFFYFIQSDKGILIFSLSQSGLLKS